VEFSSQVYRAPGIPKISSRNISSAVMSGARTVSAPKLKRTLFSFSGRQTLQGENQTLKVESTQTEALQETNRILVEIQNQLALDFANRIAERKEAISGIRRQTQKARASRKEQSVESLSKFGQGITKTFDKVTAPVKNIFSKLLEFFGIITTGILVNTAFDWLSNEENRKKLSDTLDFVGKYWKEILGGIIAIKLIGTIKSLIGAFRLASLVLRHPAFLTAAGAIVLAAGAISLGNYLREQKEKRQREYVEAITGTNYETSVSGKPAQIVPTLPPGRGYGRDKESVFDLIKEGFGFFGGMSTGGTVKKYNFNPLVRLSQGGSVGGRGSGAVDTVPAMLAPGEEVIKTSAARLFRPLLKDINDNSGRLWSTFSAGVKEMLAGNAILKDIMINLTKNLSDFKKQLDDFTFELKLKNLDEGKGGGGGYSYGRKNSSNMMMLSPGEEVIKSSAARTLMPVIKDVNVRRERKKKPSITTIPIDLGTKVVGGGQNQQPTTGSSGGKANRTPSGSPVNNSNPYMQIVPEILGIYV